MILNTEFLWNKALTDNNISGLIGCVRALCAEGEGDTSERLAGFNCWLQSSSELAQKELLMLCFSRCKGLWMFLDEDSVALVHKLVLKLKNLLSLVQLVKKNSKQEARELKKISQMWREMDQTHKRRCLELSGYAEDKHRWSSLIQGMVAHMDKHQGPVWVCGACSSQLYPPPSLEALLKLVLRPEADMHSVLATMMYFVLDVCNFLQCEEDLLWSFCRVFCIPSAFSQQIVGFWLLDRGSVTASMDVLLGPRARPPALAWPHWALLRALLRTGENRAALKYLYSITPAMENIHHIRLCADVLMQNKCVSAAWALMRGLQAEDVHLFRHFIHVRENRGICRNPSVGKAHLRNVQSDEAQVQNQETITRSEPGQTPRPLSARLYQTDPLTPADVVRILRKSVSEIRPPPKKRSVVLLPEYVENRPERVLTSQDLCPAENTSVDVHEFKNGVFEDAMTLLTEEVLDSSSSSSPDGSSSWVLCSETVVLRPSSECEDQSPSLTSLDQSPSDPTCGCPDLTLTPEGATEALSSNSLSVIEQILTGVEPGDISHSAAHAERRLLSTLNLHPNCYSNEDNQSVCSVPEIPVESHNLLSPNHEKFIYHKTVDDAVSTKPENLTETEEWVISASDDHLQDSGGVEASGTSSFLDLKPLAALSLSRLEERQEGFSRDADDAVDQPEILTSCAFTDTMHDLLAHLQQTDLSEEDREPYQACSLSALKGSMMDMDLSLLHLSQRSRPAQTPMGSQPSPGLSQASSEPRGSSPKEALCFRSSSGRVGHCKLGGWWKQALETRRASAGLLPALEQVSPKTPEKRASLPHGLRSFLDFPQVEKREAVKGEPAGRRGSFKVPISQTDHGSASHRGRRGKTSKRIKQA